MTITEISNIFQSVVNTISPSQLVYMRRTDAQANVDIDNIDLAGKYIFIFNNLPTCSMTISKSGYITEAWPIEIRVLYMETELDSTTNFSDTTRSSCATFANRFFDLVSKYQQIPDIFNYQINYLGEEKVYDKIMTGCRLSFTLNTQRSTYYCQV